MTINIPYHRLHIHKVTINIPQMTINIYKMALNVLKMTIHIPKWTLTVHKGYKRTVPCFCIAFIEVTYLEIQYRLY